MTEKLTSIKLWSVILTATFTIVGSVIAAIAWLDTAYATEADINKSIHPLTTKIELIMVAQSSFSIEVRELRKDRIRDQIREIKKEQYSIKRNIAENRGTSYDAERLQNLEFDLNDLESRLESMK